MLEYLFKVVYKDGTTYEQNIEDKPILKETGSSFSDVRQEDVETFSLVGGGHSYLVNLIDGHFEIDGVSFKQHTEPFNNFRLIYWRTVKQTLSLEDGTRNREVLAYTLGWQTTHEGENHQRIIIL